MNIAEQIARIDSSQKSPWGLSDTSSLSLEAFILWSF